MLPVLSQPFMSRSVKQQGKSNKWLHSSGDMSKWEQRSKHLQIQGAIFLAYFWRTRKDSRNTTVTLIPKALHMSAHQYVGTSKIQDLPNLQASLPSSVEGITQQFNTLTLVQLDTKMCVWGKAGFGLLHPMPGKCILFVKAKAKSSWKALFIVEKVFVDRLRHSQLLTWDPSKHQSLWIFLCSNPCLCRSENKCATNVLL